MITLETSMNVGKSPKKSPMEVNDDESGSDNESAEGYSKDNEADVESDSKDPAENDVSSEGESDHSNENEKEEEEEEVEDDNGDNTSENNTSKTKANPCWADAMRKVLSTKRPKRKKTIVLSKAKKYCSTELKEEKEPQSFEIENASESSEKKPQTTEKKITEKVSEVKVSRKKELKTGIRVKPSILDRERERNLQKIATKGVLQLFNAVRNQQRDIDKKLVEAGSLERKRDKVLKDIDKKAFLDVLMGGTKSIEVDDNPKEHSVKSETATENNKVWKVLRDDFVMGASLKDWDKKVQDEDNSSASGEIESDG